VTTRSHCALRAHHLLLTAYYSCLLLITYYSCLLTAHHYYIEVKFVQNLNLRGLELLKGRTGYALALTLTLTQSLTLALALTLQPYPNPSSNPNPNPRQAALHGRVHAGALRGGGRRGPAGASAGVGLRGIYAHWLEP
jgi:hypothetical protein